MGITGLLPFLEKICKKSHISDFRGSVVAIDAYCWLHKGAFSCSENLVRGGDTNSHINYCMKYINMLLNFNITPILVFDGQHLKAKKETEEKRRQDRKFARQKAFELLALGKKFEARQYLSRCVDITHEMALKLIKACRKINIDCIVAPYEADAQLAFLNTNGIADFVITEDSDLLPFGCKKTLFKLSIDGSCTLIDQDKLCVALQMSPDAYSFDKFRYMCILSGCDYLKSLPGIGLKKAHKAFKFTHNTDITRILPRLGTYLNSSNLIVTEEYITNFMVADATFKHQIVFNPITRKLQYLTDPETFGTNEEYLCNAGSFINDKLAFQMALGNVDPFSKKVVDDWNPDSQICKTNSIWSKHYKKKENQHKINTKLTLCFKEKKTTIQYHQVNEVDKIKEQELYNENLEEELKVYRSPPLKKMKVDENVNIETQTEYISQNPFAKNREKRMSKFNLTQVNKAQTVKSKFFSSRSKKVETDLDGRKSPSLIYSLEEKEIILSNTDTTYVPFASDSFLKESKETLPILTKQFGEENIQKPLQKLLEKFELPIKRKLTSNHKTKDEEFSDLENLTPPESSEQSQSSTINYYTSQSSCSSNMFSQEFCSTNKSISDNSFEENSQEIYRNKSESAGNCFVYKIEESESKIEQLHLEEQVSTKNKHNLLTPKARQPKKLGTCPRIGLSKQKLKPNQQTLLTMFQNMESKS